MQTGTMLIMVLFYTQYNICEGAVSNGFWIIKSWVYIHKRFRDETGNDDIGGESMFSPPTLAWQGHTWTPVQWPGDGGGDVMSVNT